jgi:hypothetical protein
MISRSRPTMRDSAVANEKKTAENARRRRAVSPSGARGPGE